MLSQTSHIPVLLNEVIEMLKAKEGGIFLDGTLGGGGHSEAILQANSTNVLFACDRDEKALERAAKRLERFGDRCKLIHCRFSEVLSLTEPQNFDGVLIDLGLSTDQLKENRGFSFNDTCLPDMRMDEQDTLSAASIVNESSAAEMVKLLREGGVGAEARVVADAIVKARPISDTKSLAKVINRALAGRTGRRETNPATVVFQAIRIAVNREYEELRTFLQDIPPRVKSGGRLACISFHSGEDKIVAGTFREWASGDTAPAYLPVAHSREVLGRIVNKKSTMPTDEEIKRNASSRSARLRVFEFC